MESETEKTDLGETMDYHGQIMNLPHPQGNALVEYLHTLQTYMDYLQAYAYGHRDARHAAAEIAAQADELECELERANDNLCREVAVLTGDNANLRAKLEYRIAEFEYKAETARLRIEHLESVPSSNGFDDWFRSFVMHCNCTAGMVPCETGRKGRCNGLSYDDEGSPDGACDECNGARSLPCPECGSLRMVSFLEYETRLRAELKSAREEGEL